MKKKQSSCRALKITTLALAFALTQGGLVAQTVPIPDPKLKAAIRSALEKPNGDITVADMASMTTLHADFLPISDLTGLEYAKNLTELDLTGDRISDISPLTNLTYLVILDLGINQIEDISPLAKLTDLEDLQIHDNQISDISPLAGLTNLSFLELGYNQIVDLSPLTGLVKLTYLDLSGNQISNLGPIAGLTNLRDWGGWCSKPGLVINRNYIDITPGSPARQVIDNLNAIEGLRVSYMIQWTGLTGEFPDPALEWVIREALQKPEGDITVADMESLTEFGAVGNRISDLTGLERATNLTVLLLDHNRISDLSPIARLINLSGLDIARNKISDLGPLAGLTNLTELDADNNSISDLSPLAGLNNLRELELSGNMISNIGPLAGLTNLKNGSRGLGLWLSHNYIDITLGSPARQTIDNLNAIVGLTVEFEPQNAPEPFMGGVPIGGQEDWYQSDWWGEYNTTFSPWLYHAEHGFVYHQSESSDANMFLYDSGMEAWCWTSEEVYPFLYAFNPAADNRGVNILAAWLWYFKETKAPRAFGVVTGASATQTLFFGP